MMREIFLILYVVSAITLLTLLVRDLKNQVSLCVGDILLLGVAVFAPVFNSLILLGLAVERFDIKWFDIKWTEILEKEVWRRKE